MSVIATALKHLIAAGVSGDDLVRAVAEMEAAAPAPVDPVAEKRRAYDRERKRVEAAAKKLLSGGIPVESAESTESAETGSLSLPPNENNSNPPTHTLPDMNTRPRKADEFPRPDWADPQVWADWMKVRTAKKASNTATAYRGFLRSIADQQTAEWPPGRLLAHAVENSWKSIHRPQESRNDRPYHDLRPSHANGSDKRSSLARAIDEGLEFLGSP